MNPPTDIHLWLESIGLAELVPVFDEHQITPEMLGTLTAEDIREMGITALGHRKKLESALAALIATPGPEVSTLEFSPQSPSDNMPVLVSLRKVEAATWSSAGDNVTDPNVTRALVPAPFIPAPVVQQEIESPSFIPAPRYKRKGFSASFLAVSIAVHLFVAVGAGYWVVQRIETKLKLQFAAGPPTANPNKRALEHKVSLQKKKNVGGSPGAKAGILDK